MNKILNYANHIILVLVFFKVSRNNFFHVCIYICIYDKRQREIEIKKTNEQKKGVQEKKNEDEAIIRARSA
jgi:hypothetical protein